jgi:hypothetical protein
MLKDIWEIVKREDGPSTGARLWPLLARGNLDGPAKTAPPFHSLEYQKQPGARLFDSKFDIGSDRRSW